MAQKRTNFAKIGDEAVKAKTGKNWKEWYKILDRLDPKTNGHRFAVMELYHKHKLSAWWSQAVTIHYEWERGLRTVKNQRQARPRDPLFKSAPTTRKTR
jgi:hypothetical protein